MIRTLFYLSLLITATNFSAQPQWQWAHKVTAPVSQERNVIEPDKQGNFYIGVNSGVGTCLIKFNSQGTELWRQRVYGPAIISGISANASDVYLVGNFQNTVAILNSTLTSAGSTDAFMLRLNAAGNLMWAKAFGGPGADYANDIVQDGSMTLRVTGDFQDTVLFDQTVLTCSCTSSMYMATYNPAGTLLSIKSTDCIWSSSSFATGDQIIVDKNHDVYVLGTNSYFMLDGFEVSGGGGPYAPWYIAKIDSSGPVLWAHQTVNNTVQELYEMALDSNGNIILNGYSHWTNGGNTTTTKIDPVNGQILWTSQSQTQCYGDQGVSEGVATQGTDSYIWGRISLGTNCTPGRQKTLLVKYNGSGQQQFIDTLELNTGFYNFDITRLLPDAFVVTGVMDPSTNAKIVFGSYTVTAYDNASLIIARFNDTGSAAFIPILANDPSTRVFPNPSNGSVQVKGLNNEGIIQVTDAMGVTIYTQKYYAAEELRIDLSSGPKGIYFVRIIDNDSQSTIKLVKD
jgi:hypothetical protein